MGDQHRRTSKSGAATIYDVAKKAQVSIKTVSNVINNVPYASAQTRARVLAAIDELSYRPNRLARGLASQKSFMLGLFCDGAALGSAYIAHIQMQVLTTCQKDGYHLVVECLDPASRNLARQVQDLMAHSSLAGVILTPPLCDLPDLIESLQMAHVPIGRYSPGRVMNGFFDADIDNVQAAYDVTAHLIGLGHKRIGFVRGPFDRADSEARLVGFRKALSDAGLSFNDAWYAEGDYTYKAGMLAGERLLAGPDRPTAIFASNDHMAAGVMASSLRFNLRVPDDLSVAGFDDSVFATAMWPGLTTCRQPIAEMTDAIVSALIRHDGERPPMACFPHEVVVRGSTGAPSNRA